MTSAYLTIFATILLVVVIAAIALAVKLAVLAFRGLKEADYYRGYREGFADGQEAFELRQQREAQDIFDRVMQDAQREEEPQGFQPVVIYGLGEKEAPDAITPGA